jgi:hypothetical protein
MSEENRSTDAPTNAQSASAPFTGANVASAMAGQAPSTPQVATAGADRPHPDHPMAQNGGVASENPPAGGLDPNMPVHSGNTHMLIGRPKPEDEEEAQQTTVTGKEADEVNARTARLKSSNASVSGPGTDHPSGGVTRTVGEPAGAAPPIEQIGDTVILAEDTVDTGRPEFEPGKPKPRTDIDADPHEVTNPAFQGLDRVNPLPITPLNTVQHRGNPNEPRVVGVTGVGDINVVGSESEEARALRGDAPEGSADADPEDDGEHVKRGKLPEDFPGRTALEEAGEATYAKVRKRLAAGTLTEIHGIGEATASSIAEAMKE